MMPGHWDLCPILPRLPKQWGVDRVQQQRHTDGWVPSLGCRARMESLRSAQVPIDGFATKRFLRQAAL